MAKKSIEMRIVDAYMSYMWNANLYAEFSRIFGGDFSNPYSHGRFLLNKYESILEAKGLEAAPSVFWSQLCNSDKEAIVGAALLRYEIPKMDQTVPV